jgi:CheY-like chemotaxis protein
MMPHEDGVQVLRKIREFSKVPALFLTAKIHENDKAEAYEKAFDFETLVEEAVENTNSITIDMNSDLDLPMLGLEVREVLNNL